jgi:hypothetical protein
MTFLAFLALGLSAAAYAKDKDPVMDEYQGAYRDEDELSGIASVALGADSLTVGTAAVRDISTGGGGKLKYGIITLGSWDYVYWKNASGRPIKIGLVIRIKAGSHNKAMFGLGKKFAEKLYTDHKDQFKFDATVSLGDIPEQFEWNFHGTKR